MGMTPADDADRTDRGASAAALELLKQLITLSSGVLALSATFVDKLFRPVWWLTLVLALCWVLLIAALIFGLQAISAMVQSLRLPEGDWAEGNTRKLATACKWAFVGGMVLFALLALLTAQRGSVQPTPSSPSEGSSSSSH